jgi:hypothetical protein
MMYMNSHDLVKIVVKVWHQMIILNYKVHVWCTYAGTLKRKYYYFDA